VKLLSNNISRHIVRQQMKEFEKNFHNLYKNAPDAISLIDANGVIINCNKQEEQLLGYNKEEIIGKHITTFHSEEYKNIFKQKKPELQENGFAEAELEITSKNGKIIPIWRKGSAIKDNNGKIEKIITFSRDISQKKRAEIKLMESQQRLRARVKELSCLYELTELFDEPEIQIEEMIQETIPIIQKALQFPELIGVKITFSNVEYKTENYEDTQYNLSIIGNIGKKELRIEVCYQKKKDFLIEEEKLLIEIMYRLRAMIEQKAAKQKLEKSKKKYKNAYETANFYKDLIAHDINNILNNIISSIHLYSMNKNNPNKTNDIDMLMDIIREQGYRGAQLISNVRKMAQLEESKISLERISVSNILQEAVNYIKNGLYGKEINLHFEIPNKPIFISANELLLDVFENLLLNAVIHNVNPLVEIIIRISLEKNKEVDYVKIEFIDNGKGIPNIQKERIFGKRHEEVKQPGRMRIGLSLVKKIIDILNGQIWVEDRVRGDYTKGSNFVLLIPKEDNIK